MPLAKANPTNIEKRNPTSIELGGGALPPPTEVPGTPTFVLTALPASIFLSISRPQTGGRAMGYRYRLRRRNAADTAWENALAWVDLGTRRSATITQYSVTQAIEVGRKYQVKVIAYNIIGDGTETAYQEVVPLTDVPAVPTFALEAHDSAIRLTLNKVSDPLNNPDYPVYSYSLEERNAADTAWVPDIGDVQSITSNPFGAAGTHRIVSDTDNQLIIDILLFNPSTAHNLINGREYRVRVRAENVPTQSAWSAWMSAIPMMGAMPAQPPATPTFTLSIEPDSFSDIIITPRATGTPNPPITHWIIRSRQKGQTAWSTDVVAADQSDYPFSVSRGQTFEFQVAARSTAGDSAFAAIQEQRVIDVPDRPGLFLTAQSGGFDVRIVEQPSGDPADGTLFRYREGTSGDWTDGTVLEVRNLKGNTLYQVEAWLTNDAGRSLSVSRTVTTLAVRRVTGQLAVYGDSLAVYGDDLKVYGG